MKTLWLILLGLLLPAAANAQRGTRFFVAGGPYRVDNVAGTPFVPMIGLFKATGQRGMFGVNLGLIREAGFYGLDALTLDIHLGRRSAPAQVEWFGTIGPTAMLGGDGDGTPYLGLGGQATIGATWWAGDRVGLMAAGTGRIWAGSPDVFSPNAMIGLALRRKPRA